MAEGVQENGVRVVSVCGWRPVHYLYRAVKILSKNSSWLIRRAAAQQLNRLLLSPSVWFSRERTITDAPWDAPRKESQGNTGDWEFSKGSYRLRAITSPLHRRSLGCFKEGISRKKKGYLRILKRILWRAITIPLFSEGGWRILLPP